MKEVSPRICLLLPQHLDDDGVVDGDDEGRRDARGARRQSRAKGEAGQKGKGKGCFWREREKGKEKRRGKLNERFFKENRI